MKGCHGNGSGASQEEHDSSQYGVCHGPECTGSMKAVGSYGRSTGTKGRVTEEDDRSRSKGVEQRPEA